MIFASTVGKFFFRWDLEDDLPEWILEFVSYASVFVSWQEIVSRRTGVYEHKTAEAEVDLTTKGVSGEYRVELKAKNLSDIQELLCLIRTGQVRPTKSYEGTQDAVASDPSKCQYCHRDLTPGAVVEVAADPTVPDDCGDGTCLYLPTA